ncbi:MAG: uroporphyrinogen decarboxylase family protein [Candidatus Hodarchaeota archaeon]
MGAPIDYREGKTLWPSVKKFIAKEFADVKLPKDIANSGRVPMIVKAIKILKEKYEGTVPVNVFLTLLSP